MKSLHWQTNDNLEKSVKASENIVKRLEDRNNDSREHRSISVTINNRDLGLEKENKALLDQIECLHKEINKGYLNIYDKQVLRDDIGAQ